MPHLNKKQNKNSNPVISRQDYHLPQPLAHQRKNKQTNKNSAQISPYKKLTETTGPHLEWRNQKKKEFNLEAGEKKISNTISLKKRKMKRQRNTTQMKEQTRNT